MQVGDRLISINGTYTEDLTLEECNQLLRDSHQQCTLEVEFDVADSVVPSSGVFNIKLPITEAGLGITLSGKLSRIVVTTTWFGRDRRGGEMETLTVLPSCQLLR